LLGLVTSILLLVISQDPLIRSVEVALGSGAVGDPAAATTDPIRIEQVARSRLSAQRDDERGSTVRRDDVMVRPLVDLSLLTTPTAAGASLVAERLTYAPGATTSVRRHTQIRVISLEAGSLDARIDGIAFLDRHGPAGNLLAREPHRVDGVVHLYPEDLLVVPAETAFAARNPGEFPAVSLEVSVQLPLPLTPMTDRLRAATEARGVHSEHLTAANATEPGVSAVVTVARITLPPGESFGIDGTALVVAERVSFAAQQDNIEGEQIQRDVELFALGERATIRTNGEVPRAVLLLIVHPAEASPSATYFAAERGHEYAPIRSA
jgi:hypothetical protein